MLSQWYRFLTHCQVIGRGRTGKTMWAEYCIREKIDNGEPFLYLAFDGESYKRMVSYCALTRPTKPQIFLDFAGGSSCYPCSVCLPNGDISAQAARLVDGVVSMRGNDNKDD